MKTVLVTGASGAIGNVVTKYLLDEPETRVRLILRARSLDHVTDRVVRLSAFWGVDAAALLTGGRLEAFAGDVTEPGLGLDRHVYDRLAGEVTHVIHSAGNVKLNMPLDVARKAAIDAIRNMVSFVDASARRGAFKKLDIVSTVGVAGRWRGLVPERPLPEVHSFHNTYEVAKAEAEAFVLSRIRDGLAATIHRPSMVVGNSSDGRIIQFQVFYHLCEFLSGKRTGGIVPDAGDAQLDVIPVDYVARAIQLSSACDDARGRIFHLCSGPALAPLITQLARHVHGFFVYHGQRLRSLRPVRLGMIRRLVPVAAALARGRVRRSLQTLPYFIAYLDELQTFDNAETGRFFGARGLTVPPVKAYLDRVLSYYLENNPSAHPAIARAS